MAIALFISLFIKKINLLKETSWKKTRSIRLIATSILSYRQKLLVKVIRRVLLKSCACDGKRHKENNRIKQAGYKRLRDGKWLDCRRKLCQRLLSKRS